MFIKRTSKTIKGTRYDNYLLVESVNTPKGPRHKVICSLGNLGAGSADKWLEVAHKVQRSLSGQLPLLPADPEVERIVAKARESGSLTEPRASNPAAEEEDRYVSMDTHSVQLTDSCEAGPVHVAHQMWQKLELEEVLTEAGLPPGARRLAELAVVKQLVEPGSEHSIPQWVERSALPDIYAGSLPPVNDTALYRNLDKLYPERSKIEKDLSDRETKLFGLDRTLFLYDLSSTYFEGLCARNARAKHGYSRDHRPDCRQVVLGMVLNRDGFPMFHEVFDGNRVDTTTVEEMLAVLEKRSDGQTGLTVVVDRGMAYKANLEAITKHKNGYHYIVASRQAEREQYLAEFESEDGWQEILRTNRAGKADSKGSGVVIKQIVKDNEVHILCVSDGRCQKDKAIREKQEKRLVAELEKLEKSVSSGKLTKDTLVGERIGRIKERFPRVARYYEISFDSASQLLKWHELKDLKEKAIALDGGYLLKTDRKDLSAHEIWRTYMLLTRVENAFRDMKGPLALRPVFHQLDQRVDTHIFICVLAYHLLTAIEKQLFEAGIYSSWETIRKELKTHQVATVSMKAKNGRTLLVRTATNATPEQREIYNALKITSEVLKPIRTWCDA